MKKIRCIKCEGELDFDDVMECPNCGSIMRLVSSEPLTVETVEDRPIANKIFNESQKLYEIEMAKIKYLDMFAGLAKLIEIDISNPARALRFLRRADYLLAIGCSYWLLAFLRAFIQKPTYRQGEGLMFALVAVGVLSSSIVTGYRHIGVIDNRAWRAHMIVLPLLILVLLSIARSDFQYIANKGIRGLLEVLILRVLCGNLSNSVLALMALVSVVVLRRMKITLLGIQLVELLSNLRSLRHPQALKSTRIKRLNKPLGIFIGVIGATVILLQVLIPIPVDGDTAAVFLEYLWFLDLLGLSLLLRARGYFQVSADSLLSVDSRDPILFLRSFDDDEKQVYKDRAEALLDYSLETRLSNHFTYFGPFIAIGSPRESVPVPGAARIVMSHREWLPRVANWMSNASLIVMYSGKTNWVNWELAKIIETGCLQKLILMIPQIRRWDRAIRSEDISDRLDRLREVFRNTRWSESLAGIQDLQDARAMLFGANGSIVVISSHPRNRDSFHLAALVAHYVLLNKNPIADLSYDVEAA